MIRLLRDSSNIPHPNYQRIKIKRIFSDENTTLFLEPDSFPETLIVVVVLLLNDGENIDVFTPDTSGEKIVRVFQSGSMKHPWQHGDGTSQSPLLLIHRFSAELRAQIAEGSLIHSP